MKQILQIKSSPMKDESFSNKLADGIVARLQKKHPGTKLSVRNLALEVPPMLTTLEFGKYSEEAIKEIFESDIIVIGISLHNLGTPAVLKAWIDQIVVAQKTFRFTSDGIVEGLVKNKKVYLAIASGAVFSDPKIPYTDFSDIYMRDILEFIGMTDVETFRVEGISIPGIKETALEKALLGVNQSIKL